jgi:hypothetical protein
MMFRVILWAARVLDVLLVALLWLFLAGEGMPRPSSLMPVEMLAFIAKGLMLLGLLLAWKWPGWGGAVVVWGYGFFWFVSGTRSALMPAFALFGATGGLFLIAWWGTGRSGARPLAAVAAAVALAAGIGWIWLGAGARSVEAKSRTLPELAGRWTGTASVSDSMVKQRPVRIELEVQADGTFRGRVGQGNIVRGSVVRQPGGRLGYLQRALGEPGFTMHLELDAPAAETPRRSSPEAIFCFDRTGNRLSGALHMLDAPEDLRDLRVILVQG